MRELDREERMEVSAPLRRQAPARATQATRAAIEELILRHEISIVFQPIVDLGNGDVAGYEALTRPERSTQFPHAGALFEAAEQVDLFEEVEGIARREAMRIASQHGGSALIFLNNSPAVFTGGRFVERVASELAAAGSIPPQRVVLEITERTAQEIIPGLSARSRELRERGFGVALDDIGAGISGLNQIMELRPNWMKLDIELVSRIDLDPLKQNLIRFFVHFARLSSMKLVAEGIERDEELRTLIDLGVSHGQGYLLGRPGVLGEGVDAFIRDRILELRERAEVRQTREPGAVRIASLAAPVATCQLAELATAVGDRAAMLLHQRGFAVLDGQRYVGWLERDEIVRACAAADRDQTVSQLEIVDCPLVGADETLGEALEIVASLPEGQQTLPLIVQSDGEIAGIATHRQILLAAADAQRRAPSHIAPLTGLPSRVQADRWIASRIKAGDPCDMAFIDLRDFDAYNVSYGFERGDSMLVRLVGLMKSMVVDVPGGAAFFAHLGEDRFLLAFSRDMQQRLVTLGLAFTGLHTEFFSARDLERQTYHCDDAAGSTREYPLTALRIVYLPGALQRVADSRSLHQLAGRLRLRRGREVPGAVPEVITEEREDDAPVTRKTA